LRDAWVALARPLGHPIPIPVGRGRQPRNTKRNGISVAHSGPCQIPITNYQLLNTRESAYITASVLLSHARSSSSAQVMSFATLCLKQVHLFSTGLGQLTEDPVLFRAKTEARTAFLFLKALLKAASQMPSKGEGHKVRSANHGPNSARMNCLTPSRPVRRHHSLPPSRSIRMLTSKNGQQACSNGVNSASA
jgi:hypothetical protein